MLPQAQSLRDLTGVTGADGVTGVDSVTGVTGPVVIIGAGAAGLTVAAELAKRGVPAEILERTSAIASAWRTRYDRLRMNTCRWYSMLSKEPFPKGTSVFPTRDEFVNYLQSYADRHNLSLRFGIEVSRIEHCQDRWLLQTSAGQRLTRQVVVSTGLQNTPRLPEWFRRERFGGCLLHSAEYRSPEAFRGRDVLVVGSGPSGLDIALDLVEGGARRVRVAVRSASYVETRTRGLVPSDLLAEALYRLPTPVADRVDKILRRLFVGDLSPWGLGVPEEGFYSYVRRTGGGPVVVDRAVLKAIKANRIEIVAAVESVGGQSVRLSDGNTLEPEAIIAATGFDTGLKPLVGHLGVLDAQGRPVAFGGPAAAPGLRFSGYVANINNLYNEGRRVAEEVSREWAARSVA